jgi:hypothetical protein
MSAGDNFGIPEGFLKIRFLKISGARICVSTVTSYWDCAILVPHCNEVLVMASSEEVNRETTNRNQSSAESQEVSQEVQVVNTTKRKPSSAESLQERRPKKQQRSLEPPRLNYGRDGSGSQWKNYMDLMQPLDPFWGLFSKSDTMDCGQVDPVSWKGQRACDWCVQAKGGGQKCSHVWIGCNRCICSLLGRHCSYSTYRPGFDIAVARRRVLARFERVRCGDLCLAQAQTLSFKHMGEENASEWKTEDRMSAQDANLRNFNAWRRNLLHDWDGGSKSNQISLLVL